MIFIFITLFSFYFNYGLAYLSCPANCNTCTTETHCTSCNSGYYLKDSLCYSCGVLFSGCISCTAQACSYCRSGSSLQAGVCVQCIANCLGCSDSLTCLTCRSTYYNKGTECVSCKIYGSECISCNSERCFGCNSAMYLNETFSCLKCTDKYGNLCQSCDINKCASCISGYELINGTCRTPCNGGMYLNETYFCLNCNDTYGSLCNTCNKTQCITCAYGHKMVNQQCSTECAYGYYQIENTNTCNSCNSSFGSCKNCSENTCFSCASGYSLINYTNSTNQYCKLLQTSSSQEEINYGLIIGVILGVFGFILFIIVMCLIFNPRKSKSSYSHENNKTTTQNHENNKIAINKSPELECEQINQNQNQIIMENVNLQENIDDIQRAMDKQISAPVEEKKSIDQDKSQNLIKNFV